MIVPSDNAPPRPGPRAALPRMAARGSGPGGAAFWVLAGLAGPAVAQQPVAALVESCAPCHGTDGIAKFGEVPNLAGQNRLYLLDQLRDFQSGKRIHKDMRYMSRHLTQKEMEAIATYFSRLPPR